MKNMEYEVNEDFRDYVDKYCKKHLIQPAEAMQHVIVKNVEELYRHKRLECKK
jgi:hypothetical protein